MVERRRVGLGKPLYSCVKCTSEGKTVVFTIKSLGRDCVHTTVQPECRKYCCRCCPESEGDIARTEGGLRSLEEAKELLEQRDKKK